MNIIRDAHFTTIALIIAIAAGALLIGNHLDLRAFGGQGLVRYPPVEIDGQTFARGADYTLSSDGEITVGYLELYGEAGSELRFEDTRQESPVVKLFVGRLMTDGYGTITTGKTAIKVIGRAEIIHFSWLGEVEITVLEGQVIVKNGNEEQMLIAPANIRIRTENAEIIQP